MDRLRHGSNPEHSGRRRARHTTAKFAGGTVLATLLACGSPALSTPEPIPTDVVHVEAPTCTLDRTPVEDKKRTYDFDVVIDSNPSDLDFSKVTYDFGNGVYKTTAADAIVRYKYPEGGNWRAVAILQINVPDGTRYDLDSYQTVCDLEASTPVPQ